MSPAEHPGDLLSAYLDGELSPADERQVEAHLVHCSACSADLDELAAARRLLRDLPPVPAPAGFVRGVVERRRRSTRRGATLALVAATVAAVAGLAVSNPAADQVDRPPSLSLSGDRSRLGTAATPGPFAGLGPEPDAGPPAAPGSDQPTPGSDQPTRAPGEGGPDGATDGLGTAPTTVPPTTGTTVPPTTGTTEAPGTAGPTGTGDTTGTTGTTGATGTTEAENGAGSEGTSDPVTVGDRIDEFATNLLELIGG